VAHGEHVRREADEIAAANRNRVDPRLRGGLWMTASAARG
jgi:hypothetical protein